jgi:hypothetical protein
MHPKGDLAWREDSVGETPAGATETVALAGMSPVFVPVFG